MFKDTKVLPFFPTTVWAHTLETEVFEPLNEGLKQSIATIMASEPEGAEQSRDNLHQLKEFEVLKPYIESAVSNVLNFLALEYGGYEITGCWANVRKPGSAAHKAPTHPNNYLSGVYYVQVQEGANVSTFHDPRPQASLITPQRTKFNEYNTQNVHLTVKTGSLIVFPAWLSHTIEPNTSNDDRISIGFNIMFTS